MATLLIVSKFDRTRRCDAKCYNALSLTCHCCCQGTNHGAGLHLAAQNTAYLARTIELRLSKRNPVNLRYTFSPDLLKTLAQE